MMIIAQDTLEIVRSYHLINDVSSTVFPELPGTVRSISSIGDLDDDGELDLVIGAPEDSLGGSLAILFMDTAGMVRSYATISETSNAFGYSLSTTDRFGQDVIHLGDINADGVSDLAVLASGHTDSSGVTGAIYILLLEATGAILNSQRISGNEGGFSGDLTNGNAFVSLGHAGDMDKDGINDLLVGAPGCNVGGSGRGGTWILYLNSNGTVKDHQLLSASSSWPGGNPLTSDSLGFGSAVTSLGDLDSDGAIDIAVGASAEGKGTIHIIRLDSLGGIKAHSTISDGAGGLVTSIDSSEVPLGTALLAIGDLNSDGIPDLAAGIPNYADGEGGVLILYLNEDGSVQHEELISNNTGLENGSLGLDLQAGFGQDMVSLVDSLGKFSLEMIAYAPQQGSPMGRFYNILMNPKPIVIRPAIKKQQLDSLGTMDLDIVGGVRPYDIIWGKEARDPVRFDSLVNAVDTVGMGDLGLNADLAVPMTLEKYKELHVPKLDSLKSKVYKVKVTDGSNETRTTDLAVGYEMTTQLSQGALYEEETGSLTKVAMDGWTNMQFSTLNVLPKNEDGWIRFKMPEPGYTMAVGFRDLTVSDVAGYSHLDQAFYFEEDQVYAWDGSAIGSVLTTYAGGEYFMLERKAGTILFSYGESGVIERFGNIDMSKRLTFCISIYTEGGTVEEFTTNFPGMYDGRFQVQHVAPLSPATGSIAINLLGGEGTYSVHWLDDDSDATIRNELASGTYEVEIYSSEYDIDETFALNVGNEIAWESDGKYLSVIEDRGLTIDLDSSELETSEWRDAMVSLNMIDQGASHRIQFKPYQADLRSYGSIVGIRAEKDIWAAWSVISYGEELIAEAISEYDRVQVAIESNDLLEIEIQESLMLFYHNGEVVSEVQREQYGESNLVVSLHSVGSVVRDLWTTIPVPILLNTSMLVDSVVLNYHPSDDIEYPVQTGSKHRLELPWSINAETIALNNVQGNESILFNLDDGYPTSLRIAISGETIQLDSSLFEFRGINHLILYDEPEVYIEQLPPLFMVELEHNMVMSPNGDQLFDELQVTGVDEGDDYAITIRDLDETLLFQTVDPNESWNGQFMNTGSMSSNGIYTYVIDINGESFTGQFMIKQ